VKPRLRVTLWRIAFVVAGVCALSGCAHHYVPSAIGDPYGFFSGVWHGFVFPYALVGSVISWSLALVDINFLSSVELVVGRTLASSSTMWATWSVSRRTRGRLHEPEELADA
jgi:hypothetical protein